MNSSTDQECNDAIGHLATFYGYEKTVTIVQGNLIEGTVEAHRVIFPMIYPIKLQEEWP